MPPVRPLITLRNDHVAIASSCLAMLLSLYVVGFVSHGVLRHMAQTLPLWIPILGGFRGAALAKWMALPSAIFWLLIVGLIWSLLAGWSHIVSGHFSPTEIAMTMILATGSLAVIWIAVRWSTGTSLPKATLLIVFSALVQLLAFRISLLPSIATR